jgi:hypothetical protein
MDMPGQGHGHEWTWDKQLGRAAWAQRTVITTWRNWRLGLETPKTTKFNFSIFVVSFHFALFFALFC